MRIRNSHWIKKAGWKRGAAFFDEIDSEEKAYWLGFLLADGNLGRNGSTVTLYQSEFDLEHLKVFGSIFEGSRIRVQKCSFGGNVYRCIIYNAYLWQSLFLKGFETTKVQHDTNRILSHIPTEHSRHFVRGFFDGDGCIYLYKNGRTLSLSFSGHELILKPIRDLIVEELGVSQVKISWRTKSKVCGRFVWGGTFTPYKVARWLYASATIALERKLQTYHSLPPLLTVH